MSTNIRHTKLTPSLATTIALCYQSIQVAMEYAAAVHADPGCPHSIGNVFLHVKAELGLVAGRIERKIPEGQRGDFVVQYKENDVLRLENIKRLYMKMTPEQQDALELIIEEITKGETIQVEYSDK